MSKSGSVGRRRAMLSDEFLIMLCAAFFLLLCLLIWIDITRWRQAMDNIREEARTELERELDRIRICLQDARSEIERCSNAIQAASNGNIKALSIYALDCLEKHRYDKKKYIYAEKILLDAINRSGE